MRRLLQRLLIFGKNLYHFTKEGELSIVASSLSFSTLLSLIPFLTIIFAILQSIGGLESIYPKVEGIFIEYMKDAAGKDASRALRDIIDHINVDTIGKTSAFFLFLTSFKLLQDLERAIHKLWNVKNTRKILNKFIIHGLLFASFPLALILYANFRSIDAFKYAVKLTQFDFLEFLFYLTGLTVLNIVMPSAKVRFKLAFYCSLLTSLVLVVVQNSFRWTVLKTFNYNKLYGGLVSLPLVMLWIYVFWMIVLAGVSFCASAHKTSDDLKDLKRKTFPTLDESTKES